MVVGWNAAPGACGGHQQVPRRRAGMETRHCHGFYNYKSFAPSVPDTPFLMKYWHNQILFKVFTLQFHKQNIVCSKI